ncbi:Unknown protein sequence [Pseudomonas syringae pv. maculicola]|nr:Unknown protein sequence [Pseudomonas syringae pv. maculicola]
MTIGIAGRCLFTAEQGMLRGAQPDLDVSDRAPYCGLGFCGNT